ncbi:MAG: 16S rRNA (guanine(527)-N(7))-methyltransferase RsmG [Burkholderia sp.]|nr:16S rRNA (guanine(527)-N(7))-methyltransferase RsmG [Burkholderia sp.]
MEINRVSLDELLVESAHILGVSLKDVQRSLLLDYLLLLVKWNSVYNLTSIKNIRQMLIFHILDSLSIIPYLSKIRPTQVLDIGSGAGIPGVVLAIVLEDWKITLNDSVHKKSAFQTHIKAKLNITNLSIVTGRVETLMPGHEVPEKFGAIVSRALTSLSNLLKFSRHLMAPGCSIWAMKGAYPDKEISNLPTGSYIKQFIYLTVPMIDADRCLIEFTVDN